MSIIHKISQQKNEHEIVYGQLPKFIVLTAQEIRELTVEILELADWKDLTLTRRGLSKACGMDVLYSKEVMFLTKGGEKNELKK